MTQTLTRPRFNGIGARISQSLEIRMLGLALAIFVSLSFLSPYFLTSAPRPPARGPRVAVSR